jgi:hypothetical protein
MRFMSSLAVDIDRQAINAKSLSQGFAAIAEALMRYACTRYGEVSRGRLS